MKLTGRLVTHPSLGQGEVIHQDEKRVTVRFGTGEKKFVYPEGVRKFLTFEDEEVGRELGVEVEKNNVQKQEHMEAVIARASTFRKRVIVEGEDGEKRLVTSKAAEKENVAFKCTWCDGAGQENRIGFDGVCSDEVIRHNVDTGKRVWCKESACHRYIKGEISREELEQMHQSGVPVCYESAMLRDWKASAGVYRTGQKAGTPMKLSKVQVNSLCAFTTVRPGQEEAERFVFGVFLVDEAYEGDDHEEGYVTTGSEFRLELSLEEAEQIRFWKYYANKDKSAKWASGLHRYINDEQAAQMLRDIAKVKKGTPQEELAGRFLEEYCRRNGIDLEDLTEPSGALA